MTCITLVCDGFDLASVIAIFDPLAHRMSEMPVVLFVDDEPSMRRVMQHALQLHGIEVHTAGSLADARAACERHLFDGAIIDVWLDDGSGFELYAWLQEHHPRVARNTLFVTGDIAANADLGRQVRALGRPVFVKPFDFDELEGTIRTWTRVSGGLPAISNGNSERDLGAR